MVTPVGELMERISLWFGAVAGSPPEVDRCRRGGTGGGAAIGPEMVTTELFWVGEMGAGGEVFIHRLARRFFMKLLKASLAQ